MTGRAWPAAAAIVALVAGAGCTNDDAADPTTADPPPGSAEVDVADSTVDEPVTSDPASGGTDPDEPATGDDVASGVEPDGVTTVTVRITAADGSVCEKCMWLADEGDERGRGLMGVTDLGEPAGMIFRFDAPTNGAFFMFGTPTPLSIAWFDADGGWVSEIDMEPCVSDDRADCELYTAGDEYQFAIEVFQGGLDALGIGPDSEIEIVAGTEADDCALT